MSEEKINKILIELMTMKRLTILFTFVIGFVFCVFASDTDDLEDEGIWIKWNIRMDGLPEYAVVGGRDQDGDLIVIRAVHEDHGLVVGKYSPARKEATIPYYNEEHFKRNFEILTHKNFIWTNASDGRIVIDGVPSRSMYICRSKINGYYLPGKLERSRCFVSSGGYEYEYSDWETLKKYL